MQILPKTRNRRQNEFPNWITTDPNFKLWSKTILTPKCRIIIFVGEEVKNIVKCFIKNLKRIIWNPHIFIKNVFKNQLNCVFFRRQSMVSDEFNNHGNKEINSCIFVLCVLIPSAIFHSPKLIHAHEFRIDFTNYKFTIWIII